MHLYYTPSRLTLPEAQWLLPRVSRRILDKETGNTDTEAKAGVRKHMDKNKGF